MTGDRAVEEMRRQKREYMRSYRQTPKGRDATRRQQKATSRALRRLSDIYPEDYQRLYIQELARLREEET